MISEKPTRPWFRFHLLTTVLMTLAAGGMLWMNVNVVFDGDYIVWRGWPWPYWHHVLKYEGVNEYGYTRSHRSLSAIPGAPPGFKRFTEPGYYPALRVLGDAGLGLFVIFAVALVSELLLRRREGRKP